ncbi:hypothetical protein EJ06DRAFT_375101 [Trichodelitschia bisporula]|uniref:Methyltransferase n=1 Tax=Trichodelitschia bisporula TaxID=703511 RepID=A0A6G1HZ97_9PEZI|nr:hypothetical protein EJ06DRAFT_375101 [Trichodelitschia bisporula]
MPHDLRTHLVYFNEEGDASPHNHVGRPVEGTVTDISGREAEFKLDEHGFCLARQVTNVDDFLDEENVKAHYYPEIEQLLKEVTGASRVIIFNHITRLSQTLDHKKAPDDQLLARPAVKWVHLDRFSAPDAARELIFKHAPTAAEAEKLVQKRYQVLNIWRPIKTILRDPFGIASEVPDSDLVIMPYSTPEEKGVKYGVRASPNHHWYYKYKQEPNEVLIFKAFDTSTSVKETRVPHSAFTDPDEEDKAPRESIETRALLFYDE